MKNAYVARRLPANATPPPTPTPTPQTPPRGAGAHGGANPAYLAVLTLLALGVAGVMAASEITASWTLKAVKSGVTYLNEVSSKSLTLNASSPTVSRYTKIVTTNEAVALDVPVLNGWCWLENTSTNTNDVVQVGVVDVNTNFLPLLMLKATESCPVRICTNITPYAKAITGTNATSIVLKQPILDD